MSLGAGMPSVPVISPMRQRLAHAFVLATALTVALPAQMQEPPSHVEPVNLASGAHDNLSPIEGLVWSDFVILPQGTPWLRLRFLGANLGKGSWIRITSVLDGEHMIMRQHNFAEWSNTSAYFNGNAVMVELFAAPGTTGNSIDVLEAIAGDLDASFSEPDSICGQTDDRVPSSDPRVGRLSMGCTAWIIDVPSAGANKLHLSAGHCVATNPVLSFAVPNSQANCALVAPPPSKQFAIDTATMQSSNGGVGNDWWVFRCFPNATTGRTSFQEQGAAFALAAALPATGTLLRNYGYGLDGTNVNNATGANGSCSCASANGTGTRNQTQQTHTGLLNQISGTSLRYDFDTCGGNSGSVVLHGATDQVLGIHTHGGCSTTAGSNNIGTAITLPALQAAIAAVAPPAVANDLCSGAIALALGANGPHDTANAGSDTVAWGCGVNVGRDLWFRYTAACAGAYTFSTCTPTRTFDTVLQVLSGSCGAMTALGCNDDTGLACGTGSTLTLSLTAGTYYVRVGGYSGASGLFDVVVSQPMIYDAGPWRTNASGGAGGAPTSLVQTSAPTQHTILGYTASGAFALADDFVTNGPWCLGAVEFVCYQTSTTAPSITGVFLEIFGGDPQAGATPIAGSPGFANNLATTAGYLVTNTMTGEYRALETTPTDGARPLQLVRVNFPASLNLNSSSLPGGRYWLQVRFTGSGATGPFVPPITIRNVGDTGDMKQWNGSAWTPTTSGAFPQGMPFRLYGASLSAPAAITPLSGGCGTTTLTVSGALHAGGFVHVELNNPNPASLPLILIGLSDPNVSFAPSCSCAQHATLDVVHLGTSYRIQAPPSPASLGFQFFVQGDEIFGATQPCDIGLGFRFGLTDGYRVRLY